MCVMRGSVSDCILPVGCCVFMCSYEYGGGGSGGLRLHFIYNLPGCCQLLVIKKKSFPVLWES